MNEDATRVLRRAKIARVATVSAKGLPNLTPLWYVFDAGRLYMNTRGASIAVKNLRANPDVVVLVQEGRGQIVRIKGTARFTRAGPTRLRAAFRAMLKYHLSPGGLANFASSLGSLPARARYYAERVGDSGVIVITPRTLEVLDGLESIGSTSS